MDRIGTNRLAAECELIASRQNREPTHGRRLAGAATRMHALALVVSLLNCSPALPASWEQASGRFTVQMEIHHPVGRVNFVGTLTLLESGKRLWRRESEHFGSGQFWLNDDGTRLAVFRPRAGSFEVLGPDGLQVGVVPLKRYLARDELALLPTSNCGTQWVSEVSLRGDFLSVVIPQDGNHDPGDPSWARRTVSVQINLRTLGTRRLIP